MTRTIDLKRFAIPPTTSASSIPSSDHRLPIILIGNKCDAGADRKVKSSEGDALATANCCMFIETSAKENRNVDEAFYKIMQSLIGRESQRHESAKPISREDKDCGQPTSLFD